MHRLQFVVLFLFLPLSLFGQHNFGIKLNGGLSWISNTYNPSYVSITYQPAISGQAGLFYSIHPGNKFVFETELLFIQIEGRDEVGIDLRGEGFITIHGTNHISYISIPVHCGLKVNRFIFNLGFQFSFVVASSGKEEIEWIYGSYESTWIREYDQLNMDKFDFGPRIGVQFQLNDKFAIEALYYHGLRKVNTYADYNLERYIQQATIGFRYSFYHKLKKQE